MRQLGEVVVTFALVMLAACDGAGHEPPTQAEDGVRLDEYRMDQEAGVRAEDAEAEEDGEAGGCGDGAAEVEVSYWQIDGFLHQGVRLSDDRLCLLTTGPADGVVVSYLRSFERGTTRTLLGKDAGIALWQVPAEQNYAPRTELLVVRRGGESVLFRAPAGQQRAEVARFVAELFALLPCEAGAADGVCRLGPVCLWRDTPEGCDPARP